MTCLLIIIYIINNNNNIKILIILLQEILCFISTGENCFVNLMDTIIIIIIITIIINIRVARELNTAGINTMIINKYIKCYLLLIKFFIITNNNK